MDIRLLFEKIDALNDAYIQVWEDCCNLESPSLYKEGVDRVGAYFAGLARKKGWQVEELPLEHAGNAMCITMNPDVQNRAVALSGHMDTVHPVGSFGTPAVRRVGDKIYGPGVTDCKGGIVAAFLAMDALDQLGYRERPVQLLLQSDEEVHSRISEQKSIHWICEKAKNAVAFLNAEPQDRGAIKLQRKGVMGMEIRIKGKPYHAGQCYLGHSAIAAAAQLIGEIEKFKDPDGITCNVGTITGGTAANVVPEECAFLVDIRYTCEEERKKIAAAMEGIVSHVAEGCEAEIISRGWRPAMEQNDQNDALFEKINEIFAGVGLPKAQRSKGNGGSDAADVTAYGIPCVDCLGTMGGGIHTLDEYGELASLAEAAKQMALIVSHL
ncbi:MAG: M20 family metallopeptidase [Clostridiales bacterium]|nr:M20 family metallopeptidase [Clostridiales bacterium]